MGNLKNIPPLRFPEFKEQWERKKLVEVAERVTTKNNLNNVKNVFTNSAVQGIVNQRDFFDKDIANQNKLLNYYVVEKDDFIYNPRISNFAPVGPISRNHIGTGVMSPLYSVFKFKVGELYFLETYFSTTLWYEYLESIANYGARFDRMNITIKDFYEMPLPFPTLPEQTRIASFFNVIDKKIAQLKQKKNLLEQYKKGVMQKLFSQELRFKDDNGREFPRWEKKKIKDVFRFKQGVQCGVENQYLEKEQNMQRFIRIIDLTNPNEPVRYINSPGFEHHICSNDLFMVRYGSPGLVGYGYEGVIANNLFRIIPVKEVINKFYYFVFNYLNQELTNLASSSTMPALSFSSLEILSILEPSLLEQAKIANFLSTIDDKINRTEKQIQQTQEWKKGLLQKMFC